MGSVTDLEKNKTTFLLCDCRSEVLVIEYDEELDIADLALYENASSYSSKMPFWQRLRYIWQILWHKQPYADQMQLSRKQILELRSFLNSI